MTRRGRRRLEWGYLGRVPFGRGVELQLERRESLRRGEAPEALLLVEHPPTYTLGRSARRGDLLAPAAWLEARGIEVAECDRGGQVTYHGPGQLVGYPIVNLAPDRRDVRRYVRDLMEALVQVLAGYGIAARAETAAAELGVWVGERKIASLGVHISRWLTTHGFALNVATDLSYFDRIVACGLPGVRMASIESLCGAAPPLPEVAGACAAELCRVFDREPVPLEAPPAENEARPAVAG